MGYFSDIQKCNINLRNSKFASWNFLLETIYAGLFYHSTILPAELTALFELSQACHDMWESGPEREENNSGYKRVTFFNTVICEWHYKEDQKHSVYPEAERYTQQCLKSRESKTLL